jgi:phosphonate degradation associated HDIG domain protein
MLRTSGSGNESFSRIGGVAMEDIADRFLALFAARGEEAYFGEGVSQAAHALQSAALAEAEAASEPLVAAALLHDIGHLVHQRGEDVAERGIDARHELIGAKYLSRFFGPAVVEPVRLHVDAKRYLCATDPGYYDGLSPASKRSLALQGGPFDPAAASDFIDRANGREAVRLRLWDDQAKIVDLKTKPVEAYRDLLIRVLAAAPALRS